MPNTVQNAKGMPCEETCKDNKNGKCTRDVVYTSDGKCLNKE